MENTEPIVMTIQEARDKLEPFEQRSSSGATVDRHHAGAHSTPTIAVVSAVATALGEDPTELKPLADAIDPESLNRLAGQWLDANRTTASINFTYCGCSVTVYGHGKIVVRPDT